MNSVTSRRALLKKMALSLVAFVPATRVLADDGGNQPPQSLGTSPGFPPPPPPPPPDASLIVDKYVAGEVLKISQNQIQLKTSSRGNVTLRILPKTRVWKGRWNTDLPIKVGDEIKAWGEPYKKGTYDVEKMWVNIVNLQGTASNIKRDMEGFQLRHKDNRQRKSHLVRINQETLVNLNDREAKFADNLVTLREGQFFQIIGLKLDDDSVLATRLLF